MKRFVCFLLLSVLSLFLLLACEDKPLDNGEETSDYEGTLEGEIIVTMPTGDDAPLWWAT